MKRMIRRMSSRMITVKIPSECFINDICLGVKHFLEILLAKFSGKRTWQEFRGAFVQKTKVTQILIDNMTILRRVYSNWSQIVNNKRLFSCQRALELLDLIRFVSKKHALNRPISITDETIRTCWGLSKLTVKDMKRDYGRTQHMVFVEFLEFLCRIAHVTEFLEPRY